MENEVLKAIRSRRSIRKFKDRQIPEEELRTVLEAGTWAPTGHNRQDCKIVAVQDPAICKKLRELNAKIWGKDFDPYYGAPTIVLVFAPLENPNNMRDGSLILGSMMLAAHSISLGSCWINREEQMFSSEEGKALLPSLGIGEGYVGVGALALGYPDGSSRPPYPRKGGYYTIL